MNTKPMNTQELHELFQKQKAAFQKNMYPSYKERVEALKTLESMVRTSRKKAEEALSDDFCTHPPQMTVICELLGPVARAKFARSQLKKWMKPQPRPVNRLLYGMSKCYVMYQPVGVVGNMPPWNFPIDISLGPLADILAAGNRAIIKPSEHAPASAELVKEMVSQSFDPDHVAVVTGGVELAEAFAKMPWDHLMYTGGPTIGKLVMRAASENLTPVTLELGGKCPIIISEDSLNRTTVADILATKVVKNGQMCITPDYLFIPENQRGAFLNLVREIMKEMFSSYTNNPQSTGLINKRSMDRLLSYIDDAKAKGATVEVLPAGDDAVHDQCRKIPFTLILNPADDMEVMKNEIFGPILPIKTYGSISEVIDYVNSHERPLALYFYTKDNSMADDMLKKTISGGACINTLAAHAQQASLPFGGIGNSGIGRHHGFEGFQTFSHPKAVLDSRWWASSKVMYPPYGEKLDKVVNWLLGK